MRRTSDGGMPASARQPDTVVSLEGKDDFSMLPVLQAAKIQVWQETHIHRWCAMVQ